MFRIFWFINYVIIELCCCSFGNEVEESYIRRLLLPRYPARAKEVWTSGLEHQGNLFHVNLLEVERMHEELSGGMEV